MIKTCLQLFGLRPGMFDAVFAWPAEGLGLMPARLVITDSANGTLTTLCYGTLPYVTPLCFRAGNWASGPEFGGIMIGKASKTA